MNKTTLRISNIDCANCAEKLRSAICKIQNSEAFVETASGDVVAKIDDNDIEKVHSIVKKYEPDAKIHNEKESNFPSHEHNDNENSKLEIISIIFCALIFGLGFAFKEGSTLQIILFCGCLLIMGLPIFFGAIRSLFRLDGFDEMLLMSIATIGAAILGEFSEAAAVMLLYRIGEFFQGLATRKSRESISALMDLNPEYAVIEIDGTPKKIDPMEIEVGDILIVSAGERIAADGTIINGVSSLDTSALTGESVPLDVNIGDSVLSGAVNLRGVLKIKATKRCSESTAAKILELTQNSQKAKAKAESFITKFAKVYTPIVILAAILIGVIPSLITKNPEVWVFRALTFLVVSCPCALVISVPLAYFAGIGAGAKNGVLFKGSIAIDNLAGVQNFAFDKTGTITEGVPKISKILCKNAELQNDVLKYAAIAEHYSNHPLALAIKSEYQSQFNASPEAPDESAEDAGFGMTVVYNGDTICVGNIDKMKNLGISVSLDSSATTVYVAKNSQLLGAIEFSDKIRKNAKKALSDIKSLGANRLILLSGDKQSAAESVANEVGISHVFGQLLPQDKRDAVLKLIEKGEKTAFIGDGINDAPVIASASAGIAMGGIGSDAAIETADIVIMDDNLEKLVCGIKIAKKTQKIVKQNIVFSLAIKLAVMILAAFGIAGMWLAVIADTGAALLAVLNSLRLVSRQGISEL